MRKLISLILCLVLALSLTACGGSGRAAGKGGALDVDYVTTDGDGGESESEEGSGSLLDWLREKLASDKARRAAENPEADGQSAGTGEASAPAAGQNRRVGVAGEESGQQSSKQEDDEKYTRKTVTMHIRCDTAVAKGMHKDPVWAGVVPASGVILATTTFDIEENTTVFDILREACRKYNIHMQYTGTASSCYIQGINNLYEFDGGRWSGWMYSVDGVYPNYGAGVYFLKPGEVVEWNYTCDLGRDLPGAEWIAGTL